MSDSQDDLAGEAFVDEVFDDFREQLMSTLTDEDLGFTPGGANPTLGELCVDIGDIEYTYIRSLKTLKHDWTYPTTVPELGTSVEKLKAWFAELDADLKVLLSGYSNEDLAMEVDRGWPASRRTQIYIYREALYIFYGRASVYLRVLRKPVTQQWKDGIGE
ncbi:MAG: DinB family protein [Chloroflexia bacterium]